MSIANQNTKNLKSQQANGNSKILNIKIHISKMANVGWFLHLTCLGTARAPPHPPVTSLVIYAAQGRFQLVS